MEENSNTKPTISEELVKETEVAQSAPEGNQKTVIFLVIGAIVLLAAIIGAIVFLLSQPAESTSHIRDIFIIFMALESLVIGAALIILIIQLSILINLLQNEIKPIVESTNETVNTVRGTAAFLSNNLTEPVIKLNEYLASFRKLIELLHLDR